MKAIAGVLDKKTPLIMWDCINGLKPYANSEAGETVLKKAVPQPDIPGVDPTVNPVQALIFAADFFSRSVLFFCNAQRFLDNPSVIQAISNLRELYKNGRCLVMFGPDILLPPELSQDVMVLDEPLPTEEEISDIVTRLHGEVSSQIDGFEPLTDSIMKESVAALCGLASFPAEQTCAMSIIANEKRIDTKQMWDRKRSTVNQTLGIEMLPEESLPSFDDVGGLTEIKEFSKALFSGPSPPRVIVWLDEIEKMYGGLGKNGVGDTSGVTQDQLGVMLKEQEFNNWAGSIAVGPPGSGKSLFARTLGKTYKIPVIMLDLGAMKGSLVGQSEQRIRAALKVVKAVAGEGGAFFVATCNDLTILPPELRRRYKYGIWFFDLPDKEERESIWKICLNSFGLTGERSKRTFDDSGWTGAEIRNVCELAWRLNQPLDKASKRIVPVCKSDSARLEKLREAAEDKFLSASHEGTYKRSSADQLRAAIRSESGRVFKE
jgi:hypothetical protein